MATIDDPVAIKHTNAIFDEDQQRWISDAQGAYVLASGGTVGKTAPLDSLAMVVPPHERVVTRGQVFELEITHSCRARDVAGMDRQRCQVAAKQPA
jgi:Flp pilus assembly CpaF family ATPase